MRETKRGNLLLAEIKEQALTLRPRLVEWRRHFHRHPELAGREELTAARLEEILASLGLSPRRLAGTGVVADIHGTGTGPAGPVGRPPAIALRADMDALPVTEISESEYASRHAGLMHACGHDGHMAMLLGAAHLLTGLTEHFQGTVRLVFQPAEEGSGGAKWLIDAGVFQDQPFGAVLGLHLWPDLTTGEVALRDGAMMAAVDQFTLTVKGVGGHGAAPHQGVDAIVAAGHVVTGLQTVVSRMVDPGEPVVVTIGTIHGGVANNVLADSVVMTGTVRTLSRSLRETLPGLLERAARGLTEAFGAQHELRYELSYHPTVNDPWLNDLVREVGRGLLGEGRVKELERPAMGSEDFAFYQEKVPGSFVLLGSANPTWKTVYPPHHPRYDMDEDALPLGAGLLTAAAVTYLGGWSQP